MEHHSHFDALPLRVRIPLHFLAGLIPGAIVNDRLLSAVIGAAMSLIVGFLLELAKPWLAARGRRLAGEAAEPAPAPVRPAPIPAPTNSLDDSTE